MYYFAYGSNLNKKQMKERCPDSKPLYTAILPNFKLIFTGWSRQWRGGVATIRAVNGGKVLGGVYEISEKDLTRLDGYEGYPKDYSRINVTVFTDNTPIQAFTYIKPSSLDETKPSVDYLTVVKQGYHDWGLI